MALDSRHEHRSRPHGAGVGQNRYSSRYQTQQLAGQLVREDDRLENARHQAALHGPPNTPITLFSGKLFRAGPRQTVPLGSGMTGEAALGRPKR
jgi:hypothetical protein